ncbi:hypothetical protein L7F22_060963 [Adiantum nelumboides]|nr:hypothetical protein [Adiantum nelumboides]
MSIVAAENAPTLAPPNRSANFTLTFHASAELQDQLQRRPCIESLLLEAVEEQEQEQDQEDVLEAKLWLLANATRDRAEMHAILAQQRDNWNKLFQALLLPPRSLPVFWPSSVVPAAALLPRQPRPLRACSGAQRRLHRHNERGQPLSAIAAGRGTAQRHMSAEKVG